MRRLVIVGCGYVGSRLARFCSNASVHITVISRDAARIQASRLAHRVIEYDWSSSDRAWRIEEPIDALVCSVSHRVDEDACGAKRNLHCRGLENVLAGFAKPPSRLIYLSTTGVYQTSADGGWIDEEAPCKPDRSGTQNALDAEAWLMEHMPSQSVILRPAGIYGPDRIPNLEALRAGTPIEVDPNTYLNLIHVDDLVQVIDQVSRADRLSHPIYNVADGHPVLRSDYYRFLTTRLNAPAPTFAARGAENNTAKRSRGQGNKRIDSGRLSREFSIPWLYPNYQAGLEPLLQARIASM